MPDLTQFDQAAIAWNDLREDDFATDEQYRQWAEKYGSYLITIVSLSGDALREAAETRKNYETLKTLVAQDIQSLMFQDDPHWRPPKRRRKR